MTKQFEDEETRRLFLVRSLGSAGAAWLAACLPQILEAHEHARQAAKAGAAAKLEFFSPEQAAEVEAIAAQIIPTDQTPGAREARVILFIDRALATFDADRRDVYRKGLKELEEAARKRRPGKRFSELPSAEQIELLKSVEKTEFFEAVRTHTITGFLANPEYGGNRDMIGWKTLGFEHRFAWDPPFGYYDREYEKDPRK